MPSSTITASLASATTALDDLILLLAAWQERRRRFEERYARVEARLQQDLRQELDQIRADWSAFEERYTRPIMDFARRVREGFGLDGDEDETRMWTAWGEEYETDEEE